jgi:hypothetical protein
MFDFEEKDYDYGFQMELNYAALELDRIAGKIKNRLNAVEAWDVKAIKSYSDKLIRIDAALEVLNGKESDS